MSLISELKRRNVIRMAGLYLVGAWLLLQIAETLLPIFHTPDWVLQALVVLLGLGLLPALMFSWLFELTPDGLKRDAEVSSASSTAALTGRRMDRLLLAGAFAVIAVLLVDRFWPDPVMQSPGAELQAADAALTDAASVDASIAVLPFLNMSPDADNEYFADGISEELLNVLAGVDGLTVASRTSSFTFKGKDIPIPEIARQLSVRHVLEGSVRKQGGRVRITAQLIRAGTDKHLWSQTYDRDLTDIFQVQQDIAESIAAELTGVLGVNSVPVTASTQNMAAYERFLRGRSRFNRRTDLVEGIADLRFAVEQDPELGEAWAYLAASYHVIPNYVTSYSLDSAHAQTREAIAQASLLLPDHPIVLAIQGELLRQDGDQIAALELLRRAAALPFPDSTPRLWLASALLMGGYLDEALKLNEEVCQSDPLVGINNGQLGRAYLLVGRDAEAAAQARLAASQGWTWGMWDMGLNLAGRDNRDAAAQWVREFIDLQAAHDPIAQRFLAALQDRGKDDATLSQSQTGFDLEVVLALGKTELYLERLQAHVESEVVQTNSSQIFSLVWYPAFSEAREHPRAFAIATTLGWVQLWESRGYPPGCLRVRAGTGDRLNCQGMRP